MCGLSLAWVTSENSTSTGMPTSFDSIFFAGPYLVSYCLRSPVLTAPVHGSTPTLFAVPPLCCPVANCSRPGPVVNCLPAPLSSQPSFVPPYHFRILCDFRSKNPLSSFAPKQTKESSAQATHIVLHRNQTKLETFNGNIGKETPMLVRLPCAEKTLKSLSST